LSNCRDRVVCAQMLDSTKESHLVDKKWDSARDMVLKLAKEGCLRWYGKTASNGSFFKDNLQTSS
jgi:hypothetical protein